MLYFIYDTTACKIDIWVDFDPTSDNDLQINSPRSGGHWDLAGQKMATTNRTKMAATTIILRTDLRETAFAAAALRIEAASSPNDIIFALYSPFPRNSQRAHSGSSIDRQEAISKQLPLPESGLLPAPARHPSRASLSFIVANAIYGKSTRSQTAEIRPINIHYYRDIIVYCY